MSIKGKERADGSVVQVEEEDDDDDSLLDFFEAKAPAIRRPLALSQTIPLISSSPGRDGSDDSESKPRRKRQKASSKTIERPAWTKPRTEDTKRSRSATARTSAEPKSRADAKGLDVIDDSDDDRRKRNAKRIQVTPPPTISAAEKKKIEKLLKTKDPPPVTLPDAPSMTNGDVFVNAADPASSSPSSRPDMGDIELVVRFVVDPERYQDGSSARAIRAYTKTRFITARKNDPLSIIVDALVKQAGSMLSSPDVVLQYNKATIRSLRISPWDMNMPNGAELDAFERPIFDKIEGRKRKSIKRRLALLGDDEPDEPSSSPLEANGDTPTLDETITPEVQDHTIKVAMRGSYGEVKRVIIEPGTTARKMIAYYTSKFPVPVAEGKRLRLRFDGQWLDPEMTAEEMDVESGDLFDVAIM